MLKQNGAETENEGRIYTIYYNPEIACSRVLQKNPNSLNIYIILLLTRKLCQSKRLQNVYPAQEILYCCIVFTLYIKPRIAENARK